jgi:hypothetical protein
MKKYFSFLILMCACFCMSFEAIGLTNEFDSKNYVYDDEGNPRFVKVYLNNQTCDTSNQKRENSSSTLQEIGNLFINLFIQEDPRGVFIAIPIRNRDRDDDDYWQCPYCDTINPASRNSCRNPCCPLYRKG